MYVGVFDWRSLSTSSWQSRLERFSNMLTPHHPSFTIYANSSARKRHAPVASWGFHFSRLITLRHYSSLFATIRGIRSLFGSSIQFTLEREKDRHLPFLDLNVCRAEQGNLETSVYRKPTHTDKYFAFDSHHRSSFAKGKIKLCRSTHA